MSKEQANINKVFSVLKSHKNIEFGIKTRVDNLNSFYVVQEDGFIVHSGKDYDEALKIYKQLKN